MVNTGAAFPVNGRLSLWGYDGRNELTGSQRYQGTDPESPGAAVPAEQYSFEYDAIGNRITHEENTPAVTTTYTSGVLNQYSDVARDSLPPLELSYTYDDDGNLSRIHRLVGYDKGDMNCDTHINPFDIDPFILALTDPYGYAEQYPNCDYLNGDINGDGYVNPFDIDPFIAYLTQGAPGMDMDYTWDAENRLTAVTPVTPVTLGYHSQKEAFKYDYLGRRVEKRSWTYDGGWGTPTVRKYVWAGWLMLLELDGDDNPVRKYTWGLDLGGQSRDREGAGLESAGGIGGLLAVRGVEDWDYYIYLHDGSGNVGQLVWWQDDTYEVPPLGPGWSPSVRFAATYEYDPYGNAVGKYGWFADDNAFRFSTKYYDAETALYYFGQRYYRPWLGRFINRDPMGETSDINLYRYAYGRSTEVVAALGHWPAVRPFWPRRDYGDCTPEMHAYLQEQVKANCKVEGVAMACTEPRYVEIGV